MKHPSLLVSLGLVAGFVACTKTTTVLNADHCANNDGDAYCAVMAPGKPYCTIGTGDCQLEDEGEGRLGCVAELPADECRNACGMLDAAECEGETVASTMTQGSSGTTGETDDSATGTSIDTTAGDGSTMTETAGPECTDSSECTDPLLPVCEGMSCVGCNDAADPDAACQASDAATPACGSEGACVECTDQQSAACGGQTPVCGADAVCVGCDEHAQCPESACHLDGDQAGACFEASEVVEVGSAAELSAAVAGLSADETAVIVLASGDYTGVTDEVTGSAEVAFIAADGASISGNSGFAVLGVSGDAIVYISGLSVGPNGTGAGLNCSGEAVWLDDAAVRNNAGVGLDISGGCRAHLRRSVVASNSGGGIDVSGGELNILNSAVGRNGDGFSSLFGGISANSATLDLRYSSIVANSSVDSGSSSLQCIGATSGSVSNAIIVADGNSVDVCASLDFSGVAADEMLGGENQSVGSAISTWFVSPATNDYHLTASGEAVFMDIAQWTKGDPLTDIDGDAIPQEMPSFPGYDQP